MTALPCLISLLVAAEPAADAGTLLPPARAFEAEVSDPLLTPAARPGRSLQTFDEALSLVHQLSTDERTAEAAVQRAEGRSRQALATMLPNARLTVTAGTDLLHPDQPPLVAGALGQARGNLTTPVVGTLNAGLTQSLVDVSAWRGLSSANAAQVSAEHNLADVRRRLTLGLARTLVQVVAAERIAELNRLALQQALERSLLTERTARLGAATQLDVVRVQQDVEVARGTLIAGDEQLRRAREALGLLVGAAGEVGVAPSFKLDSVLSRAEARCARIDWMQRADLLAAEANVESAAKSTAQASAGYLPSLGLTSNLSAITLQDPRPGRFTQWSLSAVLSVPIWEGGLRGGLIKERAAVQTQAEQALEQQHRNVSVEVARARRGVEVAASLKKAAEDARDKAAQLDALTRRAFEVGRGSSLELVQTAAALRQADVALATREYEWVSARLDALLTEARCDG